MEICFPMKSKESTGNKTLILCFLTILLQEEKKIFILHQDSPPLQQLEYHEYFKLLPLSTILPLYNCTLGTLPFEHKPSYKNYQIESSTKSIIFFLSEWKYKCIRNQQYGVPWGLDYNSHSLLPLIILGRWEMKSKNIWALEASTIISYYYEAILHKHYFLSHLSIP